MYNLDKVPIGLYEKALPSSLTWKERLLAAKNAGYDFMELSVDETDERISRLDWGQEQRQQLIKDMKETGVMIPSMCLSAHRRFPMGSEDANTRKTAMEIMQKAIYFAVDTGIQNIQLAGYDVYYENGNERTKKYFIEGLKKAVEWAGKAGVMLSIEIMDHEFMNSITKAMEYINELNSPWLKIYPDLGNLSGWGMDIPAELEVGKGHIVAIHVKETKPGIFKRVPFGEGTVPFIEAFEKLSKMNYQGPFLVEMWSDDAEDAIQTINEAIIWVKDKMRQGGIQV